MSIYRSERRRWALAEGRKPEGAPDPSLPFRAELGGGVSCRVPLVLYADEAGTLPHASKAKTAGIDPIPAGAARYSADDRATRLAAVALAWNVLRHFYPYFDVVKTDWPAALRQALGSAATDRRRAGLPDDAARGWSPRSTTATGACIPLPAEAIRADARRWRGTGSKDSSWSPSWRSPKRQAGRSPTSSPAMSSG